MQKLQKARTWDTFVQDRLSKLSDSRQDAISLAKSRTHPNAFIFHRRDITRLHEKYGKRSLPMQIINYFRKRRLAKVDFR